MSMFSGLMNQASGLAQMAAQKVGKGGPAEGEEGAVAENGAVAEQQVPVEGAVPVEGEEGAEQQGGGVAGMAAGFLGKAMAAKEGLKEKAAGFAPPNIGGIGGQAMGIVGKFMPGKGEEEVPDPAPQEAAEGEQQALQ